MSAFQTIWRARHIPLFSRQQKRAFIGWVTYRAQDCSTGPARDNLISSSASAKGLATVRPSGFDLFGATRVLTYRRDFSGSRMYAALRAGGLGLLLISGLL